VAENLEAISHLIEELNLLSTRGPLARWRLASRAARQIRQMSGTKLSWSKALSVLQAARELSRANQWLAQEEHNLAERLAGTYEGHDTDLGTIESVLQWAEDLHKVAGDPVPLAMVDSLVDDGGATKPERLREVIRDLDNGINISEEAAKTLAPLFARGVAGRSL